MLKLGSTNYHKSVPTIILLIVTMHFIWIASDIFIGMTTMEMIIFVVDCDLTMYFFSRNVMAMDLSKMRSKDKVNDIINVSIFFLVAVCSSIVCISLCHICGVYFDFLPVNLWTTDCLLYQISLWFQVNTNNALRTLKQFIIFLIYDICLQILMLQDVKIQ